MTHARLFAFVKFVPHVLAYVTDALTAWFVVYMLLSQGGLLWNYLVSTVLHLYTSIRDGKYHVVCSVGGPVLQVAECQIVHGFNLMLMTVITQLADFVYSVAQQKNAFGCIAVILGMWRMAVAQIHNAQTLARACIQWGGQYHAYWHTLYLGGCMALYLLLEPQRPVNQFTRRLCQSCPPPSSAPTSASIVDTVTNREAPPTKRGRVK